MVTQERLKELLDYNPDTGVFTWRVNRTGTAKTGSVAGAVVGHGYREIKVDGKRYKAHRLAWLYVHGKFPPNYIDHVNRVPNDNRIANLRLATNSENQQNQRKPRNNSSGVIGVSWHKKQGKWQAYITSNGRKIHLGYYVTIEEALAVRAAAKAKYHTFNPEEINEEAAQL